MAYNTIDVAEGPLGIRENMGMYLGGTECQDGKPPRALTQMMQEVASNSQDEAAVGYGSEIQMIIRENNEMVIADNGRGMPEGKNQEEAIKATTQLHASGKFARSDSYAMGTTTGMHGVGIKAVAAGSEKFVLEATQSEPKNGYFIQLEKGMVTDHGKRDLSNHPWFKDHKTGTVVTFLPDIGPTSEYKPNPMFESREWYIPDIIERLEIGAALTQGVTYILNNERDNTEEVRITYPNGLPSYMAKEFDIDESQIIELNKLTTHVTNSEFKVSLVVSLGEGRFKSFANGIPTKEGGPHEEGFRAEIGKAVSKYSSKKFTNLDVLSALDVMMHVDVPADIIQFEGQTKEKLGTAKAKKAVQQVTSHQFLDALYDNPSIADEIVQRVEEIVADKNAAAKAKDASKKLREQTKSSLSLQVSTKLKPAKSKDPSKCELVLVEGDSASEIGRDPMTQAVLPLRGKIKNVFNSNLAGALDNVEFSTIVHALGAGVGPEFDINQLNYHRIMLFADPDPDGGHITTLLIGAFEKHFPGLIDAGVLHLIATPALKATKYIKGKPTSKMYYSKQELAEDMPRLRKEGGWDITYFKGIGEISKDDVRNIAGNPETRRLIQIVKPSPKETKAALKVTLGSSKEDAQSRQDWLLNEVGPEVWGNSELV